MVGPGYRPAQHVAARDTVRCPGPTTTLKNVTVAMNTIDNSDNTETAPKTDLNMQNTEFAYPEFPALESKPPSPGPTPYVQTVVVPATQMAAALRPGGNPASDSAAPGADLPSGHGRVTAALARGTTSHSGLRAEQPLVHQISICLCPT